MSLIKPFCGTRPKKRFAKQVTSPNVSYIDNYKPNKKLNFLNLLNSSKINKSKKILKRLIAYSSISHIGYALAGLATGSNEGIQSSVIYMTIYIIMNLGFFSCLLMMRRNNIYYEQIEDLSGLSKNHPLLSLCLLLILFSLAGIPPLAGFFAKFYVFKAVLEQSMYFLAIVGLLSTVVAAFYYLRIIKIMYFDKEKDKYDTDHSLWLKFSLTVSTILILLYFIFPSQLIEVVQELILFDEN